MKNVITTVAGLVLGLCGTVLAESQTLTTRTPSEPSTNRLKSATSIEINDAADGTSIMTNDTQEVHRVVADSGSHPQHNPVQTSPAPPPQADAPTNRFRTYEIAPGESIYHVSLMWNVPVDSLQRLNGITGMTLRTGQVLKIPVESEQRSLW